MSRISKPFSNAPNRELYAGFFICIILSVVYLFYGMSVIPSGGHPFGHWLGIIGAVLMVYAEILYSVRKRINRLAGFGTLRGWLSLHIISGMVGPFLVLMHTGLQFRGLAGFTMFLTAVVAVSGFIGRYIYTAIPHTLAGTEASRQELLAESDQIKAQLARLDQDSSAQIQLLIKTYSRRDYDASHSKYLTVLGRGFYQLRFRWRLHREIQRLKRTEKGQLNELEWLLLRRRYLEFQIDMLQTARELLRLWHILHVPLGLMLFASVAIHCLATLYFRAGLFR